MRGPTSGGDASPFWAKGRREGGYLVKGDPANMQGNGLKNGAIQTIRSLENQKEELEEEIMLGCPLSRRKHR